MKLHPVVQHLGGVCSVTLQTSFIGYNVQAQAAQVVSSVNSGLVFTATTESDGPNSVVTIQFVATQKADAEAVDYSTDAVKIYTLKVGGSGRTYQEVLDLFLLSGHIPTRTLTGVILATAVDGTVLSTAASAGAAEPFAGGVDAVIYDETDRQRITAYGDPKVNLAGTFVDPNDNTFTFTLGATEYYKGITTEMSSYSARFMTQLPVALAGQPATPQGALDCITSDPVRAAQVWVEVMATRISQVMTLLRAKTPAQLVTISDSTV